MKRDTKRRIKESIIVLVGILLIVWLLSFLPSEEEPINNKDDSQIEEMIDYHISQGRYNIFI